MINFNCPRCNKEHRIEEFKTTDTPSIVKVPCFCGHIMQVTSLFDVGIYEIGNFYPPPVPVPIDYC